jgi:uncharacterized protein (DUF433 family)
VVRKSEGIAIEDRWDLYVAPIYEPTEAARLVRMSVSRVRRWLRGYEYRYSSGPGSDSSRRRQPPIVRRRDETGSPYASFLDLIELWFARAFLVEGRLSPQRVRKAFDEARAITGLDHPFARRRFFTEGTQIYMEVHDREASADVQHLLQLLSGGQWVIAPIVLQYAQRVEFDSETDMVVKWWPLGRDARVTVTPTVAFGAPTLEGRGIRTATLYDLYRAEGDDADRVAQWMKIAPEEVESAIRFEKYRLARLAA